MKDATYNLSGKFRYVIGSIPQNETNEEMVFIKNVFIKKVLYNDPATVVFWSDDTKTVAKCVGGDVYSKETGLSICILKKLIGTQHVNNLFMDWIPRCVDSNDKSADRDYYMSLKAVRARHKILEKIGNDFNDDYKYFEDEE